MEYKFWEIEIDGPDKTGKDLLCRYLCELSNWRFSINVRGLVSQLVYAEKYKRDYEYDFDSFNHNKIIIVLTGSEDDLEVRCKATNEPKYNIREDLELFSEATKEAHKYCEYIFEYNTSWNTPYMIALDVIYKINKMEEIKNGKI